MGIAVTCSKCRALFRVKDELAGRRGQCPKCRAVLVVPETNAADGQVSAAPAVNKLLDELPPIEPVALRLPTLSAAGLLAEFQGDIEPVPETWTYRLALLVVGALMVLLPAIYVGIICLVAYAVYLHAVYSIRLFTLDSGGHAGILAVILYIGGLFAGAMVLLFMIKPIFARPARIERRRSLTRDGEPVLFALVDRICDAVGALRPRRIDVDCQVNASAKFRRGLWSMIVGDDLVLTIGLSLVAGMNVEQFASVLAHEFGHFSQGLGMRMSFLIRAVSYWFTRVVYERDRWDVWLASWGGGRRVDVRIALVFLLTQGAVWLSRRILWALMMAGHVVSSYLLRQMELDADRHEARLSGSDVFEQDMRRLAVLSAGFQGRWPTWANSIARDGWATTCRGSWPSNPRRYRPRCRRRWKRLSPPRRGSSTPIRRPRTASPTPAARTRWACSTTSGRPPACSRTSTTSAGRPRWISTWASLAPSSGPPASARSANCSAQEP